MFLNLVKGFHSKATSFNLEGLGKKGQGQFSTKAFLGKAYLEGTPWLKAFRVRWAWLLFLERLIGAFNWGSHWGGLQKLATNFLNSYSSWIGPFIGLV